MAEESKVYSAYGDPESIRKLASGELPKPFAGELMICVVCGRMQLSDANDSTQWRAVDLNGNRVYACPLEFPAEGASADDFKRAYLRVFRAAGNKFGCLL